MIDIDYQQVILWVLIVLAAGFIGQFGKSFATYLIALARKKKSLPEEEKPGITTQQSEGEKSPVSVSETTGTHAKTEKKGSESVDKAEEEGIII